MTYVFELLSSSFSLIILSIVTLSLIYIGAPFILIATLISSIIGIWCGVGPLFYVTLGILIVIGVPIIRCYVLSLPIFNIIKALGILPTISETERTAIDVRCGAFPYT